MPSFKIGYLNLLFCLSLASMQGCATGGNRAPSSNDLNGSQTEVGVSTENDLQSARTLLAEQKEIEKNKKTVIDFYNLTFNQHDPAEAAKLYLGDKYIQHNPKIPDGVDGFVHFLNLFFKVLPHYTNEIKKVCGDKNYIFLHSNAKRTTNDRGQSVVDMFRLEDGKIVEHWDVIQSIPPVSLNQNTMF